MSAVRKQKVEHLSRSNLVQLVSKYMSLGKERLSEYLSNGQIPALDASIVNLVLSCIETGNFQPISKFIDEASEKTESLTVQESSVIHNDFDQEFDVDSLQKDIIKSVCVSTKLMANQAIKETERIARLRGATELLENRLFDPVMISRLGEKNLTRVYQAASSNLNNSIQFIKGVNSNLVSQLETINQVKKVQTEIEANESKVEKKSDNVEEIKNAILKRIKQRIDKDVDLF